jgi:hypothetical protein
LDDSWKCVELKARTKLVFVLCALESAVKARGRTL